MKNQLKESFQHILNYNKLNEKSKIKAGTKIDDWDLYDKAKEYFGKESIADEWLDLLSGEMLDKSDKWWKTAKKDAVLKLANDFLKDNKIDWRVKDAINQNEEGEITWVIYNLSLAKDDLTEEARIPSKQDILKLIKSMKDAAKENGVANDAEAYDIADGLLFDNPGLEAGIKKHFNVSDAIGWVANMI